MNTAETYSNIEATEIIFKILGSTYAKASLEEVDTSAVQMDANQFEKLPGLIKEFEDLFDGNIGAWDTSPIKLELDPGSKPFNASYYLVPRMNKDNFCKELL